jgi:hypothetical protein
MSTWIQVPISAICEQLIVAPFLMPLTDPSARVQLALTCLDSATGFVSALSTAWPSTASTPSPSIA